MHTVRYWPIRQLSFPWPQMGTATLLAWMILCGMMPWCFILVLYLYISNIKPHVEAIVSGRGSYVRYSDEDRAQIGRYALKHGTATTVHKFKQRYPKICESSIRSIKQAYEKAIKEVQEYYGEDYDPDIHLIFSLPKKGGRKPSVMKKS